MASSSGSGVVFSEVPDPLLVLEFYSKVAREFCEAAAEIAVNEIQSQIPPPRGAGVFPGWKAEGKLKSAVRRTGATPYGSFGWSVTVYMMPNGETDIYDHVHENGMVIRAKTAKYMVFVDEGGVVKRRKVVYIRPKQYFFSGILAAIAEFNATLVADPDWARLKASMGKSGRAGAYRRPGQGSGGSRRK